MDPDVRFGKPCIAGTRVDVATVVGAVTAGETAEVAAEEFSLTSAQIQAALQYAAHLTGTSRRRCERFLEASFDENFPLRLRHLLIERGIDCDHVITLGLRGTSDRDLLALVSAQGLVLLTQDGDFEEMSPDAGQIVISRLWQGLPIQRRVEVWLAAVDVLLHAPYAL